MPNTPVPPDASPVEPPATTATAPASEPAAGASEGALAGGASQGSDAAQPADRANAAGTEANDVTSDAPPLAASEAPPAGARSAIPAEDEPAPAARPSHRRRNVLIALGVTAAALAGSVALAVPWARTRARAEIESRCGALVGGRCTVATITYDLSGVHLAGLAFRNEATEAAGRAERVDVQLRWWPLIWRSAQGIRVDVHGAQLDSDRSIDELASEWRRLRTQRHASPGASHGGGVRLDHLEFEGVGLTASAALFVRARVTDASGRWDRGQGFTGRWANASLMAGPFTAARTGSCAVRRESDTSLVALDCEQFSQRVEIDTAEGRMAALRALMAGRGGANRFGATWMSPPPGG